MRMNLREKHLTIAFWWRLGAIGETVFATIPCHQEIDPVAFNASARPLPAWRAAS
jgi:hypothetical protein